MWRSDYKFLAGREALFQTQAGAQRLAARFSFRKSIRLFLNIKPVLEKGLSGCLEFIQTGNKGVMGNDCLAAASRYDRRCRPSRASPLNENTYDFRKTPTVHIPPGPPASPAPYAASPLPPRRSAPSPPALSCPEPAASCCEPAPQRDLHR